MFCIAHADWKKIQCSLRAGDLPQAANQTLTAGAITVPQEQSPALGTFLRAAGANVVSFSPAAWALSANLRQLASYDG